MSARVPPRGARRASRVARNHLIRHHITLDLDRPSALARASL
jgi:hypothetical protein